MGNWKSKAFDRAIESRCEKWHCESWSRWIEDEEKQSYPLQQEGDKNSALDITFLVAGGS